MAQETDSSFAAVRSLSHSETARALRAFIYTSGALGAFAQMVGLQMAVFVGFALWLGASESNIAHFMAIGSLSSLAQLLSSSLLVSRIKRKKAFVVWTGCLFVLLRFSVVLIPLFVAPSLRIPTIALLVGVGLGCWHLGGPINTGWQAQIIPEDVRTRFIGRQTVANLAVGIAASYAAGWFLDLFTDAEKYTGFLTIFAAAGLIGLYGFLNLTRVPFVHTAEENLRGNLFAPFRDRRFRRLLLFFWSWNFAWSLASSFYNVFMLKTLLISYSTVAIFSSLSMAAMVVGSKVLGGLVDRYGSRGTPRPDRPGQPGRLCLQLPGLRLDRQRANPRPRRQGDEPVQKPNGPGAACQGPCRRQPGGPPPGRTGAGRGALARRRAPPSGGTQGRGIRYPNRGCRGPGQDRRPQGTRSPRGRADASTRSSPRTN